MKVSVDIKGMDELLKNCNRVQASVIKVLPKATLHGAEIIRDDARSRIHNRSGELAASLTAQVTWDKKAGKAFSGVAVSEKWNDKFVQESSITGKRNYIPAAVEYGHTAPRAFTALEVDKEGNYKTYTKGKKKGQIKAQKASRKDKVAKPQRFMQKAFKAQKQRVPLIIEKYVKSAIEEAVR